MVRSVHTPHDGVFKKVFSNIQVAKDFLEIHLPGEVAALCDFNTLAVEPASFVEDSLAKHYSDMLYSLKIAGSDAYIYMLIEQQTKPLKMMPFRMLKYQLAIMQQYLHQGHKKLPVVVPLLFYTGKNLYPYSVNLMDCFEEPKLAKELMFKSLQLIDLSQIPDAEIRTHKSVAMLEMSY